MCDGAFLTEEYTYDAQILKHYFLEKISEYPSVEIRYNSRISSIDNDGNCYVVELVGVGNKLKAPFVLNSTYASVNQINRLLVFVEECLYNDL